MSHSREKFNASARQSTAGPSRKKGKNKEKPNNAAEAPDPNAEILVPKTKEQPLSLDQQDAAALAQKIFEWEILSEEHAAVLRSDPNQLSEVHDQCAVNTPPVGSFPPRDQFDSCIDKAELDLKITATTFSERLRAISNCLFLCRVHMMLAAEKDYAMYLEMKRIRSALHNQHYGATETILPPQLHPLLAKDLTHPRRLQAPTPIANDPLQYPMTLPARSLTFEEIGNATRVKVTGTAVAGYQRNPDCLPGHVFVSESSEGVEAFRVSSILTTENKKTLFYLVFADEGPEAVCHTSEDFFVLLSTSTVCC
ncbi:hypothetical protein DFH07DRAFT_793094 [Mycena maculata]|uniref:Uncharacterized protein n=1 Tax=Mycena maculata TaxID=230809 RepID=A0AAD7K8V2_9AGAR|nr:hypothetical protein DFH07DRAFT_793094 [Mycena maculata]